MRQPALGRHFILGPARSAARRRLTLTLGHAVRNRCASLFKAMAATEARRQRPWSAPASWPLIQRCAIRGGGISTRTTAVKLVVRASRGSAAPGSQRLVVSGARGCGAGGASGGARTSQQPMFMPRRHNAGMVSVIKSSASRAQNAWPNPATRTPPQVKGAELVIGCSAVYSSEHHDWRQRHRSRERH